MKIDIRKAEQRVQEALMEEGLKRIVKNKKSVKIQLENALRRWAAESAQLKSIQDDTFGSLKATFGLTDELANAAASAIASTISKCLAVEIQARRKQIVIRYVFVTEHFRELLELSVASFATKVGTKIEWLDWLLQSGDAVIVSGYEYTPSTSGRSGLGVMTGGQGWRVPPELSGTSFDNFIHHLFDGREKELTQILIGLLD